MRILPCTRKRFINKIKYHKFKPGQMNYVNIARNEVIITLNRYNKGLTTCDNSNGVDLLVYSVLFIVVAILYSRNKTDAYPYLQDNPFKFLFICLICTGIFGYVILCIYRPTNSPHMINTYTEGAIRYACLYDNAPIPLHPLFEDKQLFERVYNATKGWHTDCITNTIALLKALAIENCTMNKVTH